MYKNRPQRPRRRPGKDQEGPYIYPERTEKPQGPGFHRCPLCGTVLEKSEKVRSVLYPGKPDSMMEIFGCPYCYGGPIGSGPSGRRLAGHTRASGASMKKRSPRRRKARLCPVCKKELPENGLVYARFFQSSERRHAHVLGCTQCYTRRRH